MKENGKPEEKKEVKRFVIQPDTIEHKTKLVDFLNNKPKQKKEIRRIK